jgi:hypothetical protein
MLRLHALKKSLFDGNKPYHHRFSSKIIKLAIDLHGHATVGCRKITRILEVFSKSDNPFVVPHHTTVRQWIMRYACHHLQSPLEHGDDWLLIGDLTISAGKLKCLATLGVRMETLKNREDLTLAHKDVEVLGIYPTEKSTGEFIEEALVDSAKRIGGKFLAVVIDQGSDIKKGANLFKKKHPELIVMHDIAHKLSNVMEHELKNDPQWSKYIQQLNFTRRSAFQTEFAALMPKKQREKARFMDIGDLVNWPQRILKIKEEGLLKELSKERYEKYLGWIETTYIEDLQIWGCMEGIVRMIKEITRINGLSLDVYEYLKIFLTKASLKGNRIQKFISKTLHTVWEEVAKLDKKEVIISSTEVIESIFGKYKAINEGLHGITSTILGLCTFVGKTRSIIEIKNAMETWSVKKAAEFVKEKFGQTLSSLRRRYYPPIKRTKFDKAPTFSF